MWRNLDWYFIGPFSRFWDKQCFWVERNQLFFNLFRLLLLLFHNIHQLFCWLFRILNRWRKLGLKFTLKVIFRIWMFRGDSNRFICNLFWWELAWFYLLFSLELYQLFFFVIRNFDQMDKSWLVFFSRSYFKNMDAHLW